MKNRGLEVRYSVEEQKLLDDKKNLTKRETIVKTILANSSLSI